MITDFRAMEPDAVIEADLCIVGAGAAGITIARELAGLGARICLVESGGLDFDPEIQDLYAGDTVGHPYFELDVARLRYFGGSTNHWAGFCAPLTPLDFEERPWVPHSGWPLDRAALEPFYRRAHPLCELGPFAYGARLWEELGKEPAAFDPDEIEACFLRHSPPTRFGDAYRAELEGADGVQVLLHATAVAIQTDDAAATVRQVDLGTLDGKAGRVVARFYVIACGGIENARLLLLSDGVEPAGLGNRHDLVGRFFMEHPHTEPGIVVSDDDVPLREVYERRQATAGGTEVTPTFCAGPAMQARERSLNAQAYLLEMANFDSGIRAARELWWGIRQGGLPDDLAGNVWRVIRDLDDVAMFAYRRYTTGRRPADAVSALGFSLRTEQAPNPDSRVVLAPERDALGLRRVRLDWQLSAIDRHTVVAATKAFGAEFARLGLGRVRLADWLLDGGDAWSPDMLGGYHHMGTTRMAADPGKGVVDADCRVHHVDNLYMAGSSVFPTGGCTNPTLTIVALALRLADHLRPRLT